MTDRYAGHVKHQPKHRPKTAAERVRAAEERAVANGGMRLPGCVLDAPTADRLRFLAAKHGGVMRALRIAINREWGREWRCEEASN